MEAILFLPGKNVHKKTVVILIVQSQNIYLFYRKV